MTGTRWMLIVAVLVGLVLARACASCATRAVDVGDRSRDGSEKQGGRDSVKAGGEWRDRGELGAHDRDRVPAEAAALPGESVTGAQDGQFRAGDALRYLQPRSGETMLDYRDRVLPVAQLAIAPQRARVRRLRDEMVQDLGLSKPQQRELDAITSAAADEISSRVLQGVLSGELTPAQIRPMSGLLFAREILEIVARAYERWQVSLSDEQRAALAGSRFDFADNLLFATSWEDLLGLTYGMGP